MKVFFNSICIASSVNIIVINNKNYVRDRNKYLYKGEKIYKRSAYMQTNSTSYCREIAEE